MSSRSRIRSLAAGAALAGALLLAAGPLAAGAAEAAEPPIVAATSAADITVEVDSVLWSDIHTPVDFITPGFPFYFLYTLTNTGTEAVTVTGFDSRMWAPDAPVCDAFIVKTPADRQAFDIVLQPGETSTVLMDNADFMLSMQTSNECMGTDFWWDGVVTLAAEAQAPSATVASGTNHKVGETGTLTATVTSETPPTGSVQFFLDGVAVGSPVPLAGGVATLPVTGLAAGTHTVRAEYIPDGDGPLGSVSADATFVVTAVLANSGLNVLGPAALSGILLLGGAIALTGRRFAR